MTATLILLLLLIAFLAMALMGLPCAMAVSQWMEDNCPGLLENIAFWAIVSAVIVAAIYVGTFLVLLV